MGAVSGAESRRPAALAIPPVKACRADRSLRSRSRHLISRMSALGRDASNSGSEWVAAAGNNNPHDGLAVKIACGSGR